MIAPTHLCFAAFTGVALASLRLNVGEQWFGWNPETLASGIALAVGALAPDLDSRGSFLSNIFPPAQFIYRRLSHRSLLHSFLGLALMTLVLFLPLRGLIFLFKAIGTNLPHVPVSFFVIGYFSHLIADCLTARGVKFLYPYPIAFVYPSVERYRFRTGHRPHELIVSVVSLLATLAFLPILRGGGAEYSLHQVMGNIHAAYEDYRQLVGQETCLAFNGYVTLSKQPIAGEAPILEALPGKFSVFFQDQVMEIGETTGQIIATSARCLPTGRPVAVSSMAIDQESWSALRARLPEHALVSGELTADRPFSLAPNLPSDPHTRPVTVVSGQILRLDYAQPRQLLGLHVVPRIASDELSADIEILQSSFNRTSQELTAAIAARNLKSDAYERDMLYGQITALRKKESDLKNQIERHTTDQESARQQRVLFSGALSLRALFVDKRH